MLNRFLDSLGVDSQDDIISEMDPGRREDASADSMSSYDPRPPRPPRGDPQGPPDGNGLDSDDSVGDDPPPNIPQPPPVVPVPPIVGPLPPVPPGNLGAVRRRHQDGRFNIPDPIDDLVDGLDATLPTREALRKYYKKQADLTAMKAVAATYHHKIQELERLIRHPDPVIRRRAEYELQEANDMIRNDMKDAKDDSDSLSLSESTHSGNDDRHDPDHSFHSSEDWISNTSERAIPLPVLARVDSEESIPPLGLEEGDQLFEMPDLEWASDDESLQGVLPQPQDINIRTPNVNINIRTPGQRTPVTRSQTLAARTPVARPQAEVVHTPAARLRTPATQSPVAGPSRMNPIPTAPNRDRTWKRAHSGITPRDLDKWLAEVTPDQGDSPPEPQVTRSGRVSRPPARYSDDFEERRQEITREAARARLPINPQEEVASVTTRPSQRRSEPVASTSSRLPTGTNRGASTSSGTRPTTLKLSSASQKSKSTKK
jgi:hypothetical protein